METVNIADAARNLSKIVASVESGETVVLARRGKPVATIEPIKNSKIRYGLLEGQLDGLKGVDWHEPMSEDDLALWEG